LGWWVGPGGAGYLDVSVDDGDDPVAVVEGAMVCPAEEYQVVDRGFAAVDP
jgi:hypothetical protein